MHRDRITGLIDTQHGASGGLDRHPGTIARGRHGHDGPWPGEWENEHDNLAGKAMQRYQVVRD